MKPFTEIVRNFFTHHCFYLATHISFCALLSLIPLIFIAVSVVGFVLGSSQDVYHQLVQAIGDIFPQGKTFLTQNLQEVVSQRHSLGVLGVVILIFIATLLFGAIERALDVIFEAERRRNFFHSGLLSVALIFTISLFFFLPTAADLLTRAFARFGFLFPLGDLLRGKLFFFMFSFFAFVWIIMVIPRHRVRLRYAFFGGVLFAFGLVVAKLLFRWYMLRAFDQYNVIYGSLTALVLLILWIYYASNILLFASEIVAALQVRHSKQTLGRPSSVSKSPGKHSV